MKSKWKSKALARCGAGLYLLAGIPLLMVSCNAGNADRENVRSHGGGQVVTDVRTTSVRTGTPVLTTTPVRKTMEVDIEAAGSIVYDPRRSHAIPVRFGGRIEKLYVHSNFEPVRKGQKIMEIYSPEIVTAQKELLYLLKSDPGNTGQIGASKQKLRLLGLTDAQINRLAETGEESYSLAVYSPYSGYIAEGSATALTTRTREALATKAALAATPVELSIREGIYVTRGQTVFKVINTDRVWAEFTIYPDEAPYIAEGDSLVITPDFNQELKVEARVAFLQPFFQEGERFAKARVQLENAGGRFIPGQLVTARFQRRTDSVWWIPSVAVLDLGQRKVAFRKKKEAFYPVPVVTGRVSGTWSEVVSGLSGADTIASDGHYMVDNEGFVR